MLIKRKWSVFLEAAVLNGVFMLKAWLNILKQGVLKKYAPAELIIFLCAAAVKYSYAH